MNKFLLLIFILSALELPADCHDAHPAIVCGGSTYRQDLLIRIEQNWHPTRLHRPVAAKLRIAKDGKLLNYEIVQSSGKSHFDRDVLRAIEETKRKNQFAPLPALYHGESLDFKVIFDPSVLNLSSRTTKQCRN